MPNLLAWGLRAAGLGAVASAVAFVGCGGATASHAGHGNGAEPDEDSGVGGGESSSSIGTGTGGSSASSGSVTGGATNPPGGGADAPPPFTCTPSVPPPLPIDASAVSFAYTCGAVPPPSATIATFDNGVTSVFDGATGRIAGGGTYVYPGCTQSPSGAFYGLGEDASQDDLHITGMVGAFSTFGIIWLVLPPDGGSSAQGPLDASAYAGIQFDVSGNPGPLGVLTFSLLSTNQERPSSASPCGTCTGDAGLCQLGGNVPITGLTSTPKTVQVRWTDLSTPAGGTPLDPGNLAEIFWYFPWTAGASPYPVDVRLDNVAFIPR